MKKLISTLFFLFLFYSIYSSAKTNVLAENSNAKKEIKLETQSSTPQTRSTYIPMALIQNDTSLETTFYGDLGTVDIVIYGESGTIVYQNSVDTSIESQLNINTKDWIKGKYKIRFVNVEGLNLYGEFDK